MGKGSKRRRMVISEEEFEKNWNDIFRKTWHHSCEGRVLSLDKKEECPYCGTRLIVETPKAE